jgi:TolA-binding protein
MKPWTYIGAAVFCVVLVACGGDKPKELLETAEFEERQQNVAHAKQLYEDLVRLYPSSPQAEFARTRLDKLNKAQ